MLRGPVDTPKPTLDVAAFSNWLALRAVEQQSKRIDALEAAREKAARDLSVDPVVNPAREPDARGPAATGRIPSQTQPPPPSQSQPRPRSSTTQPTTTQPATAQPATPQTPAPSAPSAGQSRPAPRGSSVLESLFGR